MTEADIDDSIKQKRIRVSLKNCCSGEPDLDDSILRSTLAFRRIISKINYLGTSVPRLKSTEITAELTD